MQVQTDQVIMSIRVILLLDQFQDLCLLGSVVQNGAKMKIGLLIWPFLQVQVIVG